MQRSSLRRLIEARQELTDPFDKTAEEATPLWQLIAAEATIHISQHSYTKGSSSRPAAGPGQK